MQVTVTINGEAVSRDVEPRTLLVHFIRDTPGLTGTHWGCDTSNCGACVVLMDGKPREVLHDPRGDERGPRDPDGRVARGRRRARPGPAGLPREARAALRLLHAGDAHDDAGRCWTRTPTRPTSRSAPRSPARSAGARATRTSSPRSAGPPSTRRRRDRRHEHGHGREPPERDAGAPHRLRPAEAQGGRAVHPRQGHVPRRHPPARDGARARSCAARTRTRRSTRSTRRGRSRTRTSRRSSPPRTSRRSASRGCRRSPTTPRPSSRATRSASRARRSRASSRPTSTPRATRSSSSTSTTSRCPRSSTPARRSTPTRRSSATTRRARSTTSRRPTWEAGDEDATDRVFAEADTVVTRDIIYPRCHPAPLETCGMIADFNPETGQLNIYNGNQAPHAHRTVYAHVAGLAEHMIRIQCNDIGGGFGNKVPVYPGYVCAIAGLDRRRRPGEVDRGPLREPDVDRVRARLRDEGRRCARRTGRSPACAST